MTQDNKSINLYQQVAENSLKEFKESLFEDLNNEDFDWDLLIEMLIIEDSPLQRLFSPKSTYLGKLHNKNSESLAILEEMNTSYDDEVEEEEGIEVVSENADDDFDDF